MAKRVKARKIVKGYAEGEALVSQMALGFNHGVDPKTGVIKENDHVLQGVSMKGKVFVFPNGRGSTGGSYALYRVVQEGGGPTAMILKKADPIVIAGAVMSQCPTVDMLENGAYDEIETGDYIKVDATNGIVEITKKGER
jgi:predicted aconitase with swiveling domain